MRSFTFRNSKGSYRGIPIIAANMDSVGTFEMALALHQVEEKMLNILSNAVSSKLPYQMAERNVSKESRDDLFYDHFITSIQYITLMNKALVYKSSTHFH